MDLLTGSLMTGTLRFEPSQKSDAPRATRRSPVRLPSAFSYVADRIADAFRFRDRQHSLAPTKAQLAQEHLAHIRFSALNCHTKKGLIAHLRSFAEDEVSIDTLGELALDLENDIQFATLLRDGKAIRAFLRRRLA